MVPEFFKTVIIIVPGIPPFVELALVYMESLTLILSLHSVFLDSICPSQRVYMLLKMKFPKKVIKTNAITITILIFYGGKINRYPQ